MKSVSDEEFYATSNTSLKFRMTFRSFGYLSHFYVKKQLYVIIKTIEFISKNGDNVNTTKGVFFAFWTTIKKNNPFV